MSTKKNVKKAGHKTVTNVNNANTVGRDRSKMSFNGEKYGKGRLVLAIVEQYVKDHPGTTYAKLKEVFPSTLHSLGVVRPISIAKRISAGHKRFFIGNAIKLKDKVVAVCSDFGKDNIGKILECAQNLGYDVKMAS